MVSLHAQDSKVTVPDSVYTTAEHIPEFPGGTSKLGEFLQKNLRYPKQAFKGKITGKVFGSFIVGADGVIRDVTISQGIGYGCDEEVIRIIKLMPKWNPAMHEGKAVSFQYILPISFTLTSH